MTIDDFRTEFETALIGLYEIAEVKNLCSLSLEHVLGMNRVEVSLSRKLEISPQKLQELKELLHRLAQHEPIQYITGFTEFYGLELQVNPFTLIPRPETEELVAWVIGEVQKDQLDHLKILDIGTGSGCIAIALAKYIKNANVEAVDISQNALATAYQNASRNQVDVTFYDQNILEAHALEQQYDVIVSNPPYVRQLEKKEMRENVLSNEPDSALFVTDEDPLVFYRKIGRLAYKDLSENGLLFFEINEYLGQEMVALLKLIGFGDVTLKKDMFGKNRMIKAKR